jgi:hypothetical protein
LLTPYLYAFSLYENPSFIIFSAETEYISTRSWYRNINLLRDRIRRISYRYIDDVLSINNSRFAEFLPLIYPPELEVKETTDTASSASRTIEHIYYIELWYTCVYLLNLESVISLHLY